MTSLVWKGWGGLTAEKPLGVHQAFQLHNHTFQQVWLLQPGLFHASNPHVHILKVLLQHFPHSLCIKFPHEVKSLEQLCYWLSKQSIKPLLHPSMNDDVLSSIASPLTESLLFADCPSRQLYCKQYQCCSVKSFTPMHVNMLWNINFLTFYNAACLDNLEICKLQRMHAKDAALEQ